MRFVISSFILFLVDSSMSQEVADGISQRGPSNHRARNSRDVRTISGRISERKCQEYKELIAVKFGFGSLLWEEPSNVIKEYDCTPFVGLIVGGQKTYPGEFPHMAAIGWKNQLTQSQIDFKCGGSLISETYVLTVAHCSKSEGKPPSLVRLGDQNLYRSDDGAMPVDYDIKRLISHEKYSSVTKENDIALIELKNVVQFVNNLIRPACLSQIKSNSGQVVGIGWGQTKDNSPNSDELLKVSLEIVDSKSCWNIIEDDIPDQISLGKILPTQICAGGDRGKDTCNGDSGGPIQTSHSDASCVYDIVGLTSYGAAAGCGTSSPAVYTRVESYLDWIEKIVWA